MIKSDICRFCNYKLFRAHSDRFDCYNNYCQFYMYYNANNLFWGKRHLIDNRDYYLYCSGHDYSLKLIEYYTKDIIANFNYFIEPPNTIGELDNIINDLLKLNLYT